MLEGLFKRTTLSDRQVRAVRKTLQNLRAQRRNRFRILACIDGTDEAFVTVRFAARLAPSDECDIIVLYVRPVDQGLWSGGLQLKLARQNMMEAGFELPGVGGCARDAVRRSDPPRSREIDRRQNPETLHG